MLLQQSTANYTINNREIDSFTLLDGGNLKSDCQHCRSFSWLPKEIISCSSHFPTTAANYYYFLTYQCIFVISPHFFISIFPSHIWKALNLPLLNKMAATGLEVQPNLVAPHLQLIISTKNLFSYKWKIHYEWLESQYSH